MAWVTGRPLEGSRGYWSDLCRWTGRGVMIDREKQDGETRWFVYWAASGLVDGPFRTGRGAYLHARRALCPTAGPWRHLTPDWVFRAPGWEWEGEEAAACVDKGLASPVLARYTGF